jgi:hypothetical protein
VAEFFRNTDEQRDMQAGPAGVALAAGHAGAVVGEEEHDGVVGEPGFFEFGELLAEPLVHLGDAVVVLGPVLAGFRDVGVIGRDGDFAGSWKRVIVGVAELRFMGDQAGIS